MADVELRVIADLDSATREVAGFRKEYADLVRQAEKPLRQVNATRELEASLESTGKQVRQTKLRLGELQRELINTDHPTERLKESFKEAAKELQRLERVEATQANQLSRMRAELRGAGVDTSRLAAEQRRLSTEMSSALGAGRADAAARGIRERAAALQQQAVAQRQANMEAARDNLGVTRFRALQAEIKRATQQFQALRQSGKLTNQELAVAQQQLTQRIRESRAELRALNGERDGSGGGDVIANLGGAVAITSVIRGYTQLTDQAKKMDAQLKLATTTQEEFNRAQAETYRIAQSNNAPLADVVTLYARLAPALRDVGRGQGDAVKIIDAVTKSLRISGATAQETASTIQQFSQALGSGVLRGEEFNTLAESSPRLLRALADGLQVNVGALRAMAAEGQLTADVIANALIGQLPKLTEEAAKLPETFAGATTKFTNELVLAIAQLDKFTGASDSAIGSINRLSGAMNALSKAKPPAWLEKFGQVFKLLGNAEVQGSALSFLMFGLPDTSKQSKESADAEGAVYEYREGLFAMHAAEMQILQTRAAEDTKATLEQQVKDTEAALKKQVEAERNASSELDKAKQAQLDTQKRYKDALASLNGAGQGDGSFSQVTALKAGARQALQRGDVEEAKRQAQAAVEILQQLAEAGENTYGFAGIMKELQAIEESADQRNIDEAQAKLEKAQETAAATKAALAELKDIKVAPTLDAEAQQKLLNDLAALAKQAGVLLTVPVTPVVAPEAGTVDPSLPAAATGGILRGPGTGTSDSILARLSNGEGIINARAVQHYGAGLVHQLNRLQLPRFASGGVMGGGLSLPPIPQVSPSLLQASGGENMGTLVLEIGGQQFSVQAPRSTAEELSRTARKLGATRRR